MVNTNSCNQQLVQQTTLHIPYLWCDENDYTYKALEKYIDYKFSKYSRLSIVRIDLSFKYDTLGKYNVEYARDYFQKFLNNKRQLNLFKAEVGFAWALEFGEEAGFHYHCIFIFDDSKSQQDQTIGRKIGRYWMETITLGTGIYYCSNDDKGMFEKQGLLGIGKIHRNDSQKRANLLSAMSYLAKEDKLIQRMLPEGLRIRTFGKGEMPQL